MPAVGVGDKFESTFFNQFVVLFNSRYSPLAVELGIGSVVAGMSACRFVAEMPREGIRFGVVFLLFIECSEGIVSAEVAGAPGAEVALRPHHAQAEVDGAFGHIGPGRRHGTVGFDIAAYHGFGKILVGAMIVAVEVDRGGSTELAVDALPARKRHVVAADGDNLGVACDDRSQLDAEHIVGVSAHLRYHISLIAGNGKGIDTQTAGVLENIFGVEVEIFPHQIRHH